MSFICTEVIPCDSQLIIILFHPVEDESIFMEITDDDRIHLKQIVLFEFPWDFAEQMKIKINTAHNN